MGLSATYLDLFPSMMHDYEGDICMEALRVLGVGNLERAYYVPEVIVMFEMMVCKGILQNSFSQY